MTDTFSDHKAILFDLDGTLLETIPDLSDTVNGVLSRYEGTPTLPEGIMRGFVGGGLRQMFEKTGKHLGGLPDDLDRLFDQGMKMYFQLNGRRSYAYPGIIDALAFLKSNGFLLGCVTNKWECFTHPLLKIKGIHHYMQVIVGGDTLSTKKPDPEPILYACDQLGVLPQHAVMIGDSYFDMQSAQRAGVTSVCVNYGYSLLPADTLGADFLISSVYDFVLAHLALGISS